MSSPLAIGAVTAVLRNLLDNGMVDVGVPIGSVNVTAQPPDTIDLADQSAMPALNVFMYRASRNIGWENAAWPSRNGRGERICNPPLALNLHYLITAYANNDLESDILLGYAMHLLHERPVLDRPAVRRALDPATINASILPPAFQAVAAADLAEQVENVTITHEPMDNEEVSRLWSALQSNYRPTAPYVATVVLIQAREPASNPLPVLSRGPVDLATGRDRGPVVTPGLVPPYPTVERVEPAGTNLAAHLGEAVTLVGHHLDGTATTLRFDHRLLDTANTIALGESSDPSRIDAILPSGAIAAQEWPAGLYSVSVELTRPDEAEPRTSNIAPMMLAPEPILPPTSIIRDPGTGAVSVALSMRPELRPEQDAELVIGGIGAAIGSHPAPTSALDFDFGELAVGTQFVRLIVDGVESRLVDHAIQPLQFDPTQSVEVPA